MRWVLTISTAITRFLVDELNLRQDTLNRWVDFELSQFVVPVTCPQYVTPSSSAPLFHPTFSQCLTPFVRRCAKPNLFELSEYNRSKLLICMHACECVWCRDCSRLATVEAPHDCEDAALDDLAGERKWMRCPRPSKLLLIFYDYSLTECWFRRLPGYG